MDAEVEGHALEEPSADLEADIQRELEEDG